MARQNANGEKNMDGVEKAAILLIALGPEKSAQIFKHLKEDEIEQLTVVYSVEDMDKSLTDYKDYDLILIDTAGRSHKADDQMDELKSFIEQVVQRKDEFDFESYLTLSVTTKYKDLKSIADKYDDVDWSIIFTKLDETCSLGNILNLRMLTDRPLAYTTSGQNVPNDIEVINEQWIAKQLLGGGE